jgi:hypothetical protein
MRPLIRDQASPNLGAQGVQQITRQNHGVGGSIGPLSRKREEKKVSGFSGVVLPSHTSPFILLSSFLVL